jgi:hypothetical protein
MSALVQYEPFVNNTTKLFLEQTQRVFVNNPEGCELTQWLQFYAFDVIGEITYSKRHGFLEKVEDVDGIISYLTKLFLYVAPVCATIQDGGSEGTRSLDHANKSTRLGKFRFWTD